MKRRPIAFCCWLLFLGGIVGCIPENMQQSLMLNDASERADAAAENSLYKPVEYDNRGIKGPALVVIPGSFKSCNDTFRNKITPNNIADYGELELSNANFRVLERTDLGPLLDELTLAVNLGDRKALERFRRGKFNSTKWFVKFDIIKAEPAAEASTSFDGKTLGRILGTLTRNRAVGTAVDSVKTGQDSGVWIIGLRYKLIDASTSEQVATNYFEEKMEIGSDSISVLGLTQSAEQKFTLDSLVQRLVQVAVADIDAKKTGGRRPGAKQDERLAAAQQILTDSGYNVGPVDGLNGPKTRRAISQFQEEKGLAVSGKIDDATFAALQGMSHAGLESPEPETVATAQTEQESIPDDLSGQIPVSATQTALQVEVD